MADEIPTPAVTDETELGLEIDDARAPGDAPELEVVDEPAPKEEDARGGPGTPAAKAGGDGGSGRDTENRNLKGALREERGRRRSLLAELEAEKAQRVKAEQELEASRRREAADAERGRRLAQLDEVDDLKAAVPIIGEHVAEQVHGTVRPVVDRAVHQAVRNSQKLAAIAHEDFYTVLKESGVEDAITVDPSTGRPKDPDMHRRLFFESDDPGEDAYQLAVEMLERAGKRKAPDPELEGGDLSDEPAGDRATGRRDVLDKLDKAAQRPRGISGLPAANAPERRRLTRREIDQMTDEQRAKLPENVVQDWLMGAER